jgi:hypothetical protein
MAKLPGNLSLDELYAAYVSPGGYRPRVKVHLQELLEGGRVGHAFRELTHWTQVSVHRALGNKGRATISLANVDDRHFDNRAARVFKSDNEKITKGYLNDLHRKVMSRVREINPKRRPGARFDFQGLRSFTPDDVTTYVQFLYNFDGWQGGLKQSIAGGQPDLPALGLLQRVIIDAQGPDGRWYALFTGVVSGIEDRYAPGDVPTIELVCSDYWRLFDLSEIYTQTGPDPIADNIQATLLGQLAQASPSHNFSQLKGPKILHVIMDIVQRTMCWIPYALWKQGQVQGASAFMPDGQTSPLQLQDGAGPFVATATDPGAAAGSAVSRSVNITQQSFFNDEPFWYIPFADGVDVPETYEGHDALRHYAQATPQMGIPATSKSDGDEPTDGMPVAQLFATLLVDRYISGNKINIEIYQQLIGAIMAPWQTTATLGSAIIKRVAEATFYDLSVTPNGDLLYQIPKYNNCPGEYRPVGNLQTTPTGDVNPAAAPTAAAPLGRNSVTGQPLVAPGSINANQLAAATGSNATSATTVPTPPTAPSPTGGFAYDPSNWPEGDLDYAPAPEGFSQKGHGFNHVLTSMGNRGWRLFSSEEGLVTTVRVPAGQELIPTPDSIKAAIATGRTRFEDTSDLISRFGLRVFQAQQLFIGNLFNAPNHKEILDKLAQALMIQINGRANGGSTDLHFRPDLDVGKNVFHVERQRLLYVTNVTHTVRQGQDASTTLQMAFGHDITREITSPFVTVKDVSTLDPPTQTSSVTPPAGGTTPVAGGATTTLPGSPAAAQAAGNATNNAPGGVAGPTTAQTADFVVPQSTWSAIPGFPQLKSRLAAVKDFTIAANAPVGIAGVIKGRNITFLNKAPNDILQDAIAQVRTKLGDPTFTMTIDEYALARCVQSEAGVTTELIDSVLVAQTEINVSGGSVKKLVTSTSSKSGLRKSDGFFGQQAGRQASTDKDPTYRAVLLAKAMLAGSVKVSQVFPRLNNYCAIKAFSTQAGVVSGARKTLLGANGNGGWTQRVAWIGSLTGGSLNNKTRSIFFQSGMSAARKAAARIQIDKLLTGYGL